MNQATALLLNWKRPGNMKKVIACLKEQTVGVEIFLWNNNKKDACKYAVDVKVHSSQNFLCWPRWLMASLARTEFVFTLDDDVFLTRPTVIQECIDFFRRHNPPSDTILGIYGVKLDEHMNYKQSNHIRRPKQARNVDIVKGRFMFMKRAFVQSIPMGHELPRGDDIYISSFSEHKLIPAFLNNAWKDLPEGDVALYGQKKFHKRYRQEAVDRYFNENRDRNYHGTTACADFK